MSFRGIIDGQILNALMSKINDARSYISTLSYLRFFHPTLPSCGFQHLTFPYIHSPSLFH